MNYVLGLLCLRAQESEIEGLSLLSTCFTDRNFQLRTPNARIFTLVHDRKNLADKCYIIR